MAGIIPDPKKRSYLLPPGCKDLIDLLQRERWRSAQPGIKAKHPPALISGGEGKGGFAAIEKYVAMVFASRAGSFTLTVTPPGEPFTVNVDRGFRGEIGAHVSVPQGTEPERAVRSFFKQRDLPAPDNTEIPAQFFPDLPVYLSYELIPAASDAAQLVDLMVALLREVCERADDSGLNFSYREISIAA